MSSNSFTWVTEGGDLGTADWGCLAGRCASLCLQAAHGGRAAGGSGQWQKRIRGVRMLATMRYTNWRPLPFCSYVTALWETKVNHAAGYDYVQWMNQVEFCKHKMTHRQIWYVMLWGLMYWLKTLSTGAEIYDVQGKLHIGYETKYAKNASQCQLMTNKETTMI